MYTTKELIAYIILGMVFFLTVLVLLVFYFQKKYGDDEADEAEEREDLRDYEKYRHYHED